MFIRVVVEKALKNSVPLESRTGWTSNNQSSVISKLIYDIFGGEILKTHKKKGWHFYNRIDGKRLDFARSEIRKSWEEKHFEDLPSSPEEINNYFEQEEYSTFFVRFIRAFEVTSSLFCLGNIITN
jgi:hypothetical protein